MLKKLLLCGACVLICPTPRAPRSVQPLENPAPEGALLTLLLDRWPRSGSIRLLYAFLYPDAGQCRQLRQWDLDQSSGPAAQICSVCRRIRGAWRWARAADRRRVQFRTVSLTNLGAIYDPQADRWTRLKPPSGKEWAYIGDSSGCGSGRRTVFAGRQAQQGDRRVRSQNQSLDQSSRARGKVISTRKKAGHCCLTAGSSRLT